MTVQYYQEILSAGPVAFLKLLIKWRGGIFKLIYMDFIVFSSIYALISCIYRFILKEDMKKQFEKVIQYVNNSQSMIPVAFILGFYVTLVFGRFWTQFMTVPWITKAALLVACHLRPGPNDANDDEACLERRSIIRYLVAAQILTLNRISASVKRRFNQMTDLNSGGFLLEHESNLINNIEPFNMQPFIPISWSAAIVMHANAQGRITNESVLINMIKEINRFRQGLQELFLLDQVCVPLVYTQVVTLAVYTYFLSGLIGSQFIINHNTTMHNKDFFVPIFTILQFIVYMGWLKLALTLVNPMGEDDEDIDLNSIIDYNIQVGLAIVDNLSGKLPPFAKDIFFNQKHFELPMENSLRESNSKPFMGSVYNMKLGNDNLVTSMRSVMVGDGDDRSWNEEDIRDKTPTRKGSFIFQRPSSNRKVSVNSLFHFNFPAVSEEKLVNNEDSEMESVLSDVVVQRIPMGEIKTLIAIKEEDSSPAMEAEPRVFKPIPIKKHKLSSVLEDPGLFEAEIDADNTYAEDITANVEFIDEKDNETCED